MPDPVRMKICGLTRLDDATLAVEAGAWALGVILWPGSKRACDPAEAELIARTHRRRVEVCGVFVNAPLDRLTADVDALGLTMVQLHGEEGPAYCDEIRRRTGVKVVKAGRVRREADVRRMSVYHTDFHLLDTWHEALPGGTGETWDWGLLRGRRSSVPLILSGGLDPGNVGEAIRATRPFAVDVASGTESEPGRKDPARVRAFADAVQTAAEALDGAGATR